MWRRQRKALTPAFSNAAIRKLTNVFFDSAYKVRSFVAELVVGSDFSSQCKGIWDGMLESHPEGVVINVQQWYVWLRTAAREIQRSHHICSRMNNIA